eukprot:813640-Karenia_brevis.AAC.1
MACRRGMACRRAIRRVGYPRGLLGTTTTTTTTTKHGRALKDPHNDHNNINSSSLCPQAFHSGPALIVELSTTT